MASTPVTTTLFVGDLPMLSGVVRVTSAKEAVKAIEAGRTAVLPEGAWDEAEAVLKTFAGKQEIARTLKFAKTGSLH